VLPNKVGDPGGQGWRKDFCRQGIILVSRAPRNHSVHGGGLAILRAAAASFSAIIYRRKQLGVANNGTNYLLSGTRRWKTLIEQSK